MTPECGCIPIQNQLCDEGRRLSLRATALTPTVSPTNPLGPLQYANWNAALDAYWHHVRPDNLNARQEWTDWLVKAGM